MQFGINPVYFLKSDSMFELFLGLPKLEELRKLPESQQRLLMRRADFQNILSNVSGDKHSGKPVIPATQGMIQAYVELKFPYAKFEPHLEKGDYLADRVHEVL